MAQIVSSGQITIVDNNDARPITTYITASNGLQQVFTKDEDLNSYSPDWASVNNILTASVNVGMVGGSQNVLVTQAAQISNKKWSLNGGASIGSGNTLTINANIAEGAASQVYTFECDYTDPATSLMMHCAAIIQLAMLKTGTNAVYLIVRGTSAIVEANGATKNVAVICADLMRAAGVDTTGVTYQWYEANGASQITNAMATKYGLKTTGSGANPTASASDIGVNLPAASGWTALGAGNTLVIHESAVTGIGTYRVVAKDSQGTQYQVSFTVYDVSDPYDTMLVSTGGNALLNGVGSTNIYPLIRNGSSAVADLTGWIFNWFFYDGVAPGNRAGFIDTTRTATATGRNVTANTAGAGSVLSYDGASIAFAAGDMVKLVTMAGVAKYYEVASGTTTTNLTLRAAIVSTFLNAAWNASSIVANEFVGGKLFVCRGTGATAGMQTTNGGALATAAQITVTGYEIDSKGTIMCDAYRP